ncbi:MAG: alcohol dehydrogenase catalytic domain-containing protein [Bacteroidales bacterium]|nr:alcohol dehydrogenase catalytic domain-containing protein [Bacteroidales bacterium]MBR3287746.1 alcohol dehydrogenase catalytic domain-containing protein [Bacteroidales bacterium]
MKKIVLTGICQMEPVEAPVPEIRQPDEVLIRMKAVGVCGSDVHYYDSGKIGSQVVQYPFAVGHEGAGQIEAVGSGVKRLRPGDRVAIDPAMPCFGCDQCRAGRFHTCRHMRFLGCPGQAEGCLAEYIVMPESSCFPISDRLTYEQASVSEPLAIGVYAVQLSGVRPGQTICILGSGPIGMSVLAAARAIGVEQVYVTDKIPERLALARLSGATWTGDANDPHLTEQMLDTCPQPDFVFECCGSQDALDSAIRLLVPGGKLMIIGIPPFSRFSFDVDSMRRKEIAIQNVRRQNGCTGKTIELLEQGLIKVDHWITHRFPLERTQEAFEMVSHYRDGVLKAMIMC